MTLKNSTPLYFMKSLKTTTNFQCTESIWSRGVCPSIAVNKFSYTRILAVIAIAKLD
jgi:hypothetical protein